MSIDKVARNFFQLGRQKAMQDMLGHARTKTAASRISNKQLAALFGGSAAAGAGGLAIREYLAGLAPIGGSTIRGRYGVGKGVTLREGIPGFFKGEHYDHLSPRMKEILSYPGLDDEYAASLARGIANEEAGAMLSAIAKSEAAASAARRATTIADEETVATLEAVAKAKAGLPTVVRETIEVPGLAGTLRSLGIPVD